MGRERRLNVDNGYFHVISKSVEETNLFYDEEDYNKFLKILYEEKEKHKISIFSYALLPNHYHILLKTHNSNLSYFMKQLNFRYSLYFNNKNFRVGHLFMDRFKSFYINNEGYLLNVSRYIHLNPLESNIVYKAEEYNWSSFKFYYFDIKNFLIDKEEFYNLISMKKEDYIDYVKEMSQLILTSKKEITQDDLENDYSSKLFHIIENLEKNFSKLLDKKLFRDLVLYYLLNKNYKIDELVLYFNISKTHIYRIANKIENEIAKNKNIAKFYYEIEKRAPIFEE